MLSDSITLDNQDGTDVTYVLNARTPDSATRVVLTDPVITTRKLITQTKDQKRKSDGLRTRRIAVTLQKPYDSDEYEDVFIQASFIINVPLVDVFTEQDLRNAVSNLVDLMADGSVVTIPTMSNLDGLLRGGL